MKRGDRVTHCFDVELATMFGVNEAILINFFKEDIRSNRARLKNFHDGMYWSVISMKALQMIHPYMTVKRIKSATVHLQREGVLLIGEHGKDYLNRTKWYTLTERGWRL